jgi:hypothetical protein
MAAPSRGVVVTGVVGAALLGVVLLGGSPADGPPLDPRSDGPLGTSALVSLLEGLGADVELSAGLPGAEDDVALVLSDRLDEDQTEEVLSWVRRGGTLVVTDPASSFTPDAIGGTPADDEDLGRGICTIDALRGVDRIDGGAAFLYSAASARSGCFGSLDFAFVVASEEGKGDIVAVGGAAFATNDRLGREDNAALAAALLAPTTRTSVRIVDAPLPAGGGEKTLGDLVSDGVRRGGLQLAIAFLLYATWRAVRLGRVVPEGQPVDIAGSELVGAAGRVLERGRAAGGAAEVLRDRLRRALRARYGVGPTRPASDLVEVVAARTGIDRDRLMTAVGGRSVTSDDELVAVADAVATVHQEVLR